MTATEPDRAPSAASDELRERLVTAAVVLAPGPLSQAAFSSCWAAVRGRPLLAWSVDVLDACAAVSQVVLVVPRDRLMAARELAAVSGWRHVRAIPAPRAAAAPSRQLLAALEVLGPACDTIVLHDGARLLLTPDLLTAGLQRAGGERVVLVATRVQETIKWVDERGDVRRTPPRASLWHCQTPVIFPRSPVEARLRGPAAAGIAARARSGGLAWLLAACAGCQVRIVRAGYDEVLVRTPADVEVAEALLLARAGR